MVDGRMEWLVGEAGVFRLPLHRSGLQGRGQEGWRDGTLFDPGEGTETEVASHEGGVVFFDLGGIEVEDFGEVVELDDVDAVLG